MGQPGHGATPNRMPAMCSVMLPTGDGLSRMSRADFDCWCPPNLCGWCATPLRSLSQRGPAPNSTPVSLATALCKAEASPGNTGRQRFDFEGKYLKKNRLKKKRLRCHGLDKDTISEYFSHGPKRSSCPRRPYCCACYPSWGSNAAHPGGGTRN